MSESEYNKRKRAASALDLTDDDVEERYASDEEISPPKKIGGKQAAGKKGIKKANKKHSLVEELFGEEPPEPSTKTSPLWSAVSRHVADGVLRQAELIGDGEFFVDLKVYNTQDIIDLEPLQRYDKWSAQLRVRLAPEDPVWSLVKKLYAEGRKKFKNEPVFYADKLIKK